MREFPAEIGHKQEAMQEETKTIVQSTGLPKGLMPALVRQYPNADKYQPLETTVRRPIRDTEWGGANEGDEGSEIEERSAKEKIANEV